MISKHVIRHDPLTGVKTWCEQDYDGVIRTWQTQDAAPVMDANKEFANGYRRGSMQGNTQRHGLRVAEVPVAIYQGLVALHGKPRDNPKKWAEILNDPANRDFRTGGGRIAQTDLR